MSLSILRNLSFSLLIPFSLCFCRPVQSLSSSAVDHTDTQHSLGICRPEPQNPVSPERVTDTKTESDKGKGCNHTVSLRWMVETNQWKMKKNKAAPNNPNILTLWNTDTVHEYLCLPHEPKFKGINMSATLDALIPRVIAHIVVFVRLEEVLCSQLITLP